MVAGAKRIFSLTAAGEELQHDEKAKRFHFKN
jgi:hypothetical protein